MSKRLLLAAWLGLTLNATAGQLTIGDWDFLDLPCFPGYTDNWDFIVIPEGEITIDDIQIEDLGGMMQYAVVYSGGGILNCNLTNCYISGDDGADFSCEMPDDIFNHYYTQTVVEPVVTFCDHCDFVEVVPEFMDFGTVTVGEHADADVFLYNFCDYDWVIDTTFCDDPVFTTDLIPPLVVPPNDSAQVIVTFAPTAEQEYPAVLYICSNDPATPHLVFLTGNGVEESAEQMYHAAPAGFAITGVYPNPFNPTVQVRYAVPRTTVIAASVYDLRGRLVAVLDPGAVGPGQHLLTWRPSGPAGLYFLQLRSDSGWRETRRLIYLK